MDDKQATAEAGWYPDYQGGGNLRYWDGSQWTSNVHQPDLPASLPYPAPRVSLGPGRELVLGGGIALAVSPFLTWVTVVLIGNLSLFQLFTASGRSSTAAWPAVVAGGTAAVVAWRERSAITVRSTGFAVGLLGGALAVFALTGLRHDIREADGLAAIGIGPYVAVGGCLAMVVGAAMARRQG
jgi:branched-subunit amino acid transport protein